MATTIQFDLIAMERTGPRSAEGTARVGVSCTASAYIGYQKRGSSVVSYPSSATLNNQTSHSWANVRFQGANVGPGAGTYTSSPDARGFSQVYQGNEVYSGWKTFTFTLDAYAASVTLNPTDGQGGTATVEAVYGEAMPTITPPTRTGYAFAGYFSEPGGAGTKYYNADGSSARSADLEEDTTLYAHWEAMSILHLMENGALTTVTDIRVAESGTVKRVLSVWSVEGGVPRQGI